MNRNNEYGQPIGDQVADWAPRPALPRAPLTGRFCRVEPADAGKHAADLYDAYRKAPDGRDWTYMSNDFFSDFAQFRQHLDGTIAKKDSLYHVIIDLATGKPTGAAALMRNDPSNGVIEVGNISYSPALKQTAAATEAMYLLMKRVFDELGYRRYEWKCDALNAASRKAARRLGFQFEGIFRQAVVYKGRNRDTAWFSIIDPEWPAVRDGFERWLDPGNFDPAGRQIERLNVRPR